MNNLLNNIKMNYEVAENQNELFTNSHRKYSVVIKHNGRQYTTTYQCNIKNVPTVEDVMYCLYMDSTACDYIGSNVWDFANEYGYTIESKEDYNKVQKIVKACERTAKALSRLFTSEELVELAEIMQEM